MARRPPFDRLAFDAHHARRRPDCAGHVRERSPASEAEGQTDADYRIPKGLTLRDEIARYFRIGQALFARSHASSTCPRSQRRVASSKHFCARCFGFADFARVGTRDRRRPAFRRYLGGARRPRAGRRRAALRRSRPRQRPTLPRTGRRRSAASALQDWLNASDGALWGFCSNGERLRLMRDNASLTRPAYIEADLRQIFEAEVFADFAALWLLIHASRFGAPARSVDRLCAGTLARGGQQRRARPRATACATGSKRRCCSRHTASSKPKPRAARARCGQGELPLTEFFGQLLRLVYRLIFLLAAEDRDLLHAPDALGGGAQALCGRLFARRLARPCRPPRRLGPAPRPLGGLARSSSAPWRVARSAWPSRARRPVLRRS